ncbi:hypothetical protein AM586_08230 [Massilia sp. WG5]|nr:hypothetical protein AM586_08230 [Massilia sp. WG5]
MEMGRLREEIARMSRANIHKAKQAKLQEVHMSESTAHAAFADTVWTMRQVLERVNADGEMFEVDLERCEIRDLAAAPGRRTVVSGQRLRPFIAALRTLKEQEK